MESCSISWNTRQATTEAILNAMIGAETMVRADWMKVHALPRGRLQEILGRYNRLEPGRDR